MIIYYQQDSQGQICQYTDMCAICWYPAQELGDYIETYATDIPNGKWFPPMKLMHV